MREGPAGNRTRIAASRFPIVQRGRPYPGFWARCASLAPSVNGPSAGTRTSQSRGVREWPAGVTKRARRASSGRRAAGRSACARSSVPRSAATNAPMSGLEKECGWRAVTSSRPSLRKGGERMSHPQAGHSLLWRPRASAILNDTAVVADRSQRGSRWLRRLHVNMAEGSLPFVPSRAGGGMGRTMPDRGTTTPSDCLSGRGATSAWSSGSGIRCG